MNEEMLKAINEALEKFRTGLVFVEPKQLEAQFEAAKNHADAAIKEKYEELMAISKAQGEAIRTAMETMRKSDNQ